MYKLIKLPNNELSEYAIRLSDGVFVHRELNQAYLKWLAEGNTPEEASTEVSVPADNTNKEDT